ncbi:MAG: YIP1 family protein [Hyalangium sp.]
MEGVSQAACAVHPERVALQPCGRCGTFACEECLRDSPPGETLCAACVAREGTYLLPWDERQELGIVRAWFKSVLPIMLRPRATFSAAARRPGDAGGSILFALIANFLGFFTTLLLFTLLMAFMPIPMEPTPGAIPYRALMVGTYGSMIVLAPLFGLAATVLMAAIDHVVMRIFGKPQPFETTLRAASLAQAPLALGVIPFCSLYIAPFWVLVAKVFAYKGLHRTTTGVAAAGALLAPVVATVLFCGAYAILIAAVMTMASGVK